VDSFLLLLLLRLFVSRPMKSETSSFALVEELLYNDEDELNDV
jgi:hypothetical protein